MFLRRVPSFASVDRVLFHLQIQGALSAPSAQSAGNDCSTDSAPAEEEEHRRRWARKGLSSRDCSSDHLGKIRSVGTTPASVSA
jgi:hypothetical protein